MLVGTDGYLPPMGSVGVVVHGPDHEDDYDVLFPAHPWRTSPLHQGEPVSMIETDDWCVPRRWLMRLDDPGLALLIVLEQGVMA